eukprot:6833539-Pyramimonas_sp.AAC.1
MEILSITCSHTNAGLRCAKLCSSSPHAEICTDDGKLSLDKILAMAPSYKEPLEVGLEWVVIRRQCEDAMPELASFLSEAGNSGHGSHRVPTKMQVLMQIHKKAASNFKAFKDRRGFTPLQ